MPENERLPLWPVVVLAAALAVLLGVNFCRADERAECERLAPKYAAETEARLWDGTRVDLLNETHAIEVDWPHKWAEAIGQSLYYADLTDRRPGIVLLVSDAKAQARYVYRCQTVCAHTGIDLYIERVKPTPAEPRTKRMKPPNPFRLLPPAREQSVLPEPFAPTIR